MRRHLYWNGCFNARDLGGLKLSNGQDTVWRSIVRADSLDRLTLDEWTAVAKYGVRTIVDMRSDFEREAISERGNSAIRTIHRPLEDIKGDADFWAEWSRFNCTPIYYSAFLKHCPTKVAGVFREIAQAEAGGIIFHCGSGRDRTGLIAILLLAPVGVTSSEIVDDYKLTTERLRARPGQEMEDTKIDQLLTQEKTTFEDEIVSLLSSFNVETYLLKAGLSPVDIESVRSRLAPGL